MLDVTCIHAAACDLAIAVPRAVSMSGVPLQMAILRMYERANVDFTKDFMLAVMDLQMSRLLSARFQVQCLIPFLTAGVLDACG